MDEMQDGGGGDYEQGYLGPYGVLIVPPANRSGEWFVTLSVWDDDLEGYRAGTEGPLLASREEAMRDAAKVMDWLADLPADADVPRLWTQMQQTIARHEGLEGDNAAIRMPWTI